jgi:hypothetical protein
MQMDNIADLETGELSTPLLSPSRSIDPMQWNEEETLSYLSGSRFADLAPKFDKVDGKELCFLTERQIVGIVGGARGCVLFNEIKALRKAAELDSERQVNQDGKGGMIGKMESAAQLTNTRPLYFSFPFSTPHAGR